MHFFRQSKGIANDAIMLAFVQGIQILTGIIQTAILSRVLSKHDYGTYSQGMLIISFVTPFLLLGLNNAINYFNNQLEQNKREYINNIFGFVILLGSTGFILTLLLKEYIINYFSNAELRPIIAFVAVRPLLQNIIALFLPLYISDGKTKVIAIRNLAISILQVIIIAIATMVLEDIIIIFFLLVTMDILQILLFYVYYKTQVYGITFYRINPYFISPILKYSIPLAVSTMVSTLSINMDKLLIGKMMSTEDYATYSLMSKELPFSFLVTAFTTVITPDIIRKIAQKENELAIKSWRNYIQLGYKVTIIMTCGAIVCAKELLCFLYSDKYLDGIYIFIVYILVSTVRFTYYGLILSAYGKTSLIMYVSIFTLFCNFIFNGLFYHWWGMIGPALASLLIIGICGLFQLIYSCNLLKIHIKELFDLKYLIKFLISVIAVSSVIYMCKSAININITVCLFVTYGINTVILLLLHHKSILYNLKEINGKKETNNANEY